jgi:hypothetical protein
VRFPFPFRYSSLLAHIIVNNPSVRNWKGLTFAMPILHLVLVQVKPDADAAEVQEVRRLYN